MVTLFKIHMGKCSTSICCDVLLSVMQQLVNFLAPHWLREMVLTTLRGN